VILIITRRFGTAGWEKIFQDARPALDLPGAEISSRRWPVPLFPASVCLASAGLSSAGRRGGGFDFEVFHIIRGRGGRLRSASRIYINFFSTTTSSFFFFFFVGTCAGMLFAHWPGWLFFVPRVYFRYGMTGVRAALLGIQLAGVPCHSGL